MCFILLSCCLIFPSYNRFIKFSRVLSVEITHTESIKAQFSSNIEKKSQILSSALYLL
jgi:hypothetical protein